MPETVELRGQGVHRGELESLLGRAAAWQRLKPVRKGPHREHEVMSDLETEREAISEHQIGEVAGMIWRQLAAQGELSPAALAERLSVSPEAVCMSIGWLAREEKLIFALSGGGCAIRLR